MMNLESFDHDLIVEHGKQQAACCIYYRVTDSEALEAGHSQLKRCAHVGTYLWVCHCQQLLLALGTKNEVLEGYCEDEDPKSDLNGQSRLFSRMHL